MTEIKYLVGNAKELEILEKAYAKLSKYYDLEVSFKGLTIEPGIASTATIYPSHPEGEIISINRNSLEVICDEDYCESCSLKDFNNIQKTYADVLITGTDYNIKYKHQHF